MPANTTSLYSSSSSNITLSSNNLTTLYPGSSGTVTPAQPYGNANVVSLLAVGTDGANTVGNISATGNITGNYFIGNGSQLTGITGTYSNANVVTLLANFGSNTISTTGNVTGGNVLTGGIVSATGNVTGSYILGNGSQLTGLPATYSNANVVSLLAAFGSNTISTTGNITAGNVIAGAVNSATVYSNDMATQGSNFVQMQYSNAVSVPVSPYSIGTGSWFYLDPSGGVFESNTTGTLQSVALGNDGSVSATGNINTSDQISATGNITTAGYFIGTFQGNISGNLTVPGSNTDVLFNSNGNAGASNNFTFDSSTNRLSVTGNVAAANVLLPNGAALWQVSATETELTANVVTDTTGVYLQNNGEAAVYGNTNVVLQAGSGGVNQDWTFAPSGNLTLPSNTAGINYANGTSILAGLGSTYGNANVSNFLANGFGSNTITTTGNITSGNVLTGGIVSATGNITGSYFLGNGSQLTGLPIQPGTYGNANVSDFLANGFGSNAISTTGNVTAGYFVGNGSLLTSLTGANVTGTVANATYAANAGAATTAVTANTVTDAAQANITSVGTLSSVSVSGNTTSGNLLTAGIVSATGNITGSYILGNGSQLTGLPAGYSNADVVTLLAAFGSNNISTTGNITAGNFIGNGSLLTNITGANVTGTVANATYAISAGTATTANTVTDAAQANITSVGTLTSVSVSGNTTTGNLLTAGVVSATGNITGSYIIGNGSQLTGLPSDPPAGSNTQVQFNDNGLFGGSANLTFDKFTGNFTSGNIVTVGSTINNTNAFAMSPANTLLSLNNARIVVGNGYDGNTAVQYDAPNVTRGSRLSVQDKVTYDYTANSLQPGGRLLTSYLWADLANSTIGSASSTRLSSAAFVMNVGNGNSVSSAVTAMQAIQAAVLVGNANTTGSVGNMGNSVVNYAIAQGSFVNVYAGSTANTAIGTLANPLVAQSGGNIGNTIGFGYARNDFTSNVGGLSTWSVGFFHPDNSAQFGLSMAANVRLSSNYYAFYNKDNYADVQLGSLRGFHYYTSNVLVTGGSQVISKINGPYQTTTGNLTANLDITGFSNFVTNTTVTAGSNSGTKLASDVVTLLVPMGATPYSINMPTGNASIKYVGNISTVTGTANSMVQVQITGSNVGGTTQYLVNMENSGSNILTDGLISATGNITGGNVISLGRSQAVNFSETVTAFGNATGTITPNISLGAIQTMTLTGNITLNAITNIATGQSMTLILTQDATGGRTLTSSMLFAGGNKTLSTAGGAKDLVVLFYDGSTYYASLSKGYA